MSPTPEILARGPWEPDAVDACWSDAHFEPGGETAAAADAAIAALRERGSPSHDGLSGRLIRHAEEGGRLVLELQPSRWGLRLIQDDAQDSVAAICLTRSADGRWLAGRRAAWLSTLPGRWALGAGGAIDVGEHPVATLHRELAEEWSVQADRLQVEALIRLPHRLVLFVGMAWLPDGAEVVPDEEHDAHAWWPEDPARWPDEAGEELRRVARMLGG